MQTGVLMVAASCGIYLICNQIIHRRKTSAKSGFRFKETSSFEVPVSAGTISSLLFRASMTDETFPHRNRAETG